MQPKKFSDLDHVTNPDGSELIVAVKGVDNIVIPSNALPLSPAVQSAIGDETTRALTAEALLASIASPNLTGSPTAPTASSGDSTTRIATTQFVAAETQKSTVISKNYAIAMAVAL